MKKFLKVFLVFFLVLSFGIVALSAEVSAASTNVGEVSIFSYYKSEDGLGHSFLMFENYSDESYMVGHYSLDPGETVTVGTWGNLPDGKGVYYNLEAYCVNTYGYWSGRVSLKMDYTESELDTFTSYINANNTWTYRKNCSFFAERIWNSVASGSDEVNAGFIIKTPKTLVNNIKDHSTYYYNQSIPSVVTSDVKRHTASSSSSVSSGTLSSSSSS